MRLLYYIWTLVIVVGLATLYALQAQVPVVLRDSPSTVLVLVNDLYPAEAGTGTLGASVFVGQHYAQVRHIPTTNVLHLSIPLSTMHYVHSDFISYQDYLTYIQTPVQQYLAQTSLTNSILYIVPTYGVPYMLDSLPGDPSVTWRVSLDSVLAGMNSGYVGITGQNPYYSQITSSPVHFDAFINSLGWKMYLVTRLDGPSALISAGLVDKAQVESSLKLSDGTGYYDFQNRGHAADDSYWIADQTMLAAYNESVSVGIPSVLNDQSVSGGMITHAPNSLFIWGWYGMVHDVYTMAPGAVGAQLTSYTANSIRDNGVPEVDGQWVPYFLRQGITATWGATGEPYTQYYANGDNLFHRFWQGFNFAEAAYLSNPVLNWMMVFVGDPLYAPYIFGSPGLVLSKCDLNQDRSTDVRDVSLSIDKGNVLDVQAVLGAAIGFGCRLDP